MKFQLNFLNNFKLYKRVSLIEKYFITLIILLIVLSIFIGIPTDTENIGISSHILNIGDRPFYINNSELGFGYNSESVESSKTFAGNILYPYILKLITFISGLFNQNEFSKLWNFLCIFITSSLSIINLHLLRISTNNLFKNNITEIASFIFICNPYTYFYSLSGGIANYTLFGVTFILWIFTRSIKSGYKITEKKNIFNISLISLGTIYLSSLRPNGSIFSLIILIFLLFKSFRETLIRTKFNPKCLLKNVVLISSLIIVIYNFNSSLKYSVTNIKAFYSEGGFFFGYSRDLLRSQLTFNNSDYFQNFKNFIYFLLWKITDFVSGISDIRDTHNATNFESLMPFILRTFNGIFILFPLNLFSFLGLITNIKFIIKKDIWIIFLASFLAISPSLIGVAASRYLIMFYNRFIIFYNILQNIIIFL